MWRFGFSNFSAVARRAFGGRSILPAMVEGSRKNTNVVKFRG